MRSRAPEVLPIFRSQHQALLLAALFLHPGREYGISELARQLDVPVSTLHREVDRLIRAGIVAERTVGRTRLLSAQTASRLSRPLTELLMLTYGPVGVIG